MFAEPLMLLGPSSCKAIRIQCGKCQSSLSLSVQATLETLPAHCPGCGNEWADTPETTTAISALRVALRQWSDSEGTKSPFLIRLEVAPATHRAPAIAGEAI
jgi:hypothetical protein